MSKKASQTLLNNAMGEKRVGEAHQIKRNSADIFLMFVTYPNHKALFVLGNAACHHFINDIRANE